MTEEQIEQEEEKTEEDDEELCSTETWLKNMHYYLKTERMMFRGLL